MTIYCRFTDIPISVTELGVLGSVLSFGSCCVSDLNSPLSFSVIMAVPVAACGPNPANELDISFIVGTFLGQLRSLVLYCRDPT